MNGTATCEICGQPNANVAYFRTGLVGHRTMAQVGMRSQ
jgi:hypothetical protein